MEYINDWEDGQAKENSMTEKKTVKTDNENKIGNNGKQKKVRQATDKIEKTLKTGNIGKIGNM